jgi:hypothetical protein
VDLKAGGIATNNGTHATICGNYQGVFARSGAASGAGVRLEAGGTVSNIGTAALVSGNYTGVYARGSAATITNEGTIFRMGTHSDGVHFDAGGTLTNAGSILGYEAVRFDGGFANRLIIEPGALFFGKVDDGDAISATTVSHLS